MSWELSSTQHFQELQEEITLELYVDKCMDTLIGVVGCGRTCSSFEQGSVGNWRRAWMGF
jgi:hypothetical protein